MTEATRSPSDTSPSLRQALEYCLDVLKMKQHFEFMIRTTANVPLSMVRTLGNWIIAMKLIADWNGALGNGDDYVFSQTQLYDFLALATKVIEGNKRASDNKIVLEILRDIMENYESFSHRLKSDYPRIIVDVISILYRGIDTNWTRVNSIAVGKYYQTRKQQAAMDKEKTSATATKTTAATAIHKEKIPPLSHDELLESLVHITNRERKELQKSIEKLPYSDLKKISELCRNYSKLQRYSKLITEEDSHAELKNEIQREIGREIRSDELGHAIRSIRRVQLYIENILDNKFTLDTSHGINHIKHNLEYGYRLMNLIELPRRRPRTRYQK
jgi:hypothetical protein